MEVTPRKGVAAEEVLKAMSAVIEASHEEADEESEDAEEPLDESKEEPHRFRSIIKPKIRKSAETEIKRRCPLMATPFSYSGISRVASPRRLHRNTERSPHDLRAARVL